MTITVVPRNYENLYGLLIKKEQQLRPKGAFYLVPEPRPLALWYLLGGMLLGLRGGRKWQVTL